MAIFMLKIRRPLGRLIFNMGIAIPGKTVFLIETAPSSPFFKQNPSFCFTMSFIPQIQWEPNFTDALAAKNQLAQI